MRRIFPWALLVFCITAGGAFYWWQLGRVPVKLLRPPILTATWDQYTGWVADRPAAVGAGPLIQVVERANRADIAGGADPRRSAAFTRAAVERAEAAWQYAQQRSPEMYVDLGRRRGLALLDAVDALLGWCRIEKKTLAQALALDPRPPAVESYVRLGGGLIRFAEEAGLLVDNALPGQRRPFLQAVFLSHWIAPLRARMPLDAFISGQERVWFLRWKVELQTEGGLEGRLEAADELRTVADYPADVNAGVLLHQAGRDAEALARFTRSKHPRAREYARALKR